MLFRGPVEAKNNWPPFLAKINIANTEGIDYIYKKMREFEKSDEKGVKYPRFKVHDDSSCVYLDIYKD